MINYSYDGKTNIVVPDINFVSTGVMNDKIKTCGSRCFYMNFLQC